MKPQFNTAPDAFTLAHAAHEPEFQQAYKGMFYLRVNRLHGLD